VTLRAETTQPYRCCTGRWRAAGNVAQNAMAEQSLAATTIGETVAFGRQHTNAFTSGAAGLSGMQQRQRQRGQAVRGDKLPVVGIPIWAPSER
jgi:hypothetical protein